MTTTPDQFLAIIRAELGRDNGGTLAHYVRELDAHLSAGGAPPEAWREGPDAPADERDEVVVTFTRGQVEAWAGRPLTDDEADRLDDVIPNSSIPEAVATIVDNL